MRVTRSWPGISALGRPALNSHRTGRALSGLREQRGHVRAVHRSASPDISSREDRLDPPQVVAHRLGVSTRTLARWRQLDDGPAWTRVGTKAIRYRRGDVMAWLAGQDQGGEVYP